MSGNDKRAREFAIKWRLHPEAAGEPWFQALTSLLDSVESEGRKRGLRDAEGAVMTIEAWHVSGSMLIGQEATLRAVRALASKEETNE